MHLNKRGLDMTENILTVKDLKVSFYYQSEKLQVIRGFDLTMEKGDIIGVVGESGSGKTVSSSTIIRLIDDEDIIIDSGQILYDGTDLVTAKDKHLRNIRGRKISFIFQNPSQALHPYKRVGTQLKKTLKLHGLPYKKQIIIEALKDVGLKDAETIYNRYPFQLSGGQNQRIMIAQCIICKPDILIADEPTSAIDASLKKKVLDLLKDINKKYGMSIILITHDFGVAKYLCNRLFIMYGGLVVEEGNLNDVFSSPLHPYTSALIKCSTSLENSDDFLYTIDGTPLTPYNFKDECPFHFRCEHATSNCQKAIPKMTTINQRKVRCILHEEGK